MYLLLLIIIPVLSITLNNLVPDDISIPTAEFNSEIIKEALYNFDEIIIPNNT